MTQSLSAMSVHLEGHVVDQGCRKRSIEGSHTLFSPDRPEGRGCILVWRAAHLHPLLDHLSRSHHRVMEEGGTTAGQKVQCEFRCTPLLESGSKPFLHCFVGQEIHGMSWPCPQCHGLNPLDRSPEAFFSHHEQDVSDNRLALELGSVTGKGLHSRLNHVHRIHNAMFSHTR